MVAILPFRGVRPQKEFVASMSAPPYDVINSQEARDLCQGFEKSYLRITRPEVDFPDSLDEHDDKVYEQGKINYEEFKKQGWLFQDERPCYYIYKQTMGPHAQVGIVAVASVEDYDQNKIKKHEFTRPDKEDDRTRHVDTVGANTEPVFFTFKHHEEIDVLIKKWMKEHSFEYDFTTPDGVNHTLWKMDDEKSVQNLQKHFESINYMYIADGHHRSAAASRVCALRKEKNPNHTGKEEYNTFLTVVFSDQEMNIMAYNRTVQDLNGLSKEEFLKKVREKFEVSPTQEEVPPSHLRFCMYLEGQWYALHAKPGSFEAQDAVKRLDAAILQDNLLQPILGIDNPRTNKRIHFVGGIRGTQELKKLVDSKQYQVAFSLYPVTMNQLMDVADSGQVMPPKSTWFEPKLRSGLFIHELNS